MEGEAKPRWRVVKLTTFQAPYFDLSQLAYSFKQFACYVYTEETGLNLEYGSDQGRQQQSFLLHAAEKEA